MKEDIPTPEALETNKRYGSAPHIKNVINLLNQNSYHHRMHDIFRDFVALTAISLSNAVDKVHYEEREAQYMDIVGKYSKDEVQRFSEAFAELVMAYEYGFDDVLGNIYMQLELGNERAGQFFTPYCICQMMAKIVGPTKDDIDNKVHKKGFVEANDPCVGAGAMVIALAEEMHNSGINYQQCLHVSATDIDITAVHMSYIQLTMYHIPAVITWGNTITLETWGYWYTFAHCIGQWEDKLRAAKMVDRMITFMKQTSIADTADTANTDHKPDPAPFKPNNQEPDQPILIGEQITLF